MSEYLFLKRKLLCRRPWLSFWNLPTRLELTAGCVCSCEKPPSLCWLHFNFFSTFKTSVRHYFSNSVIPRPSFAPYFPHSSKEKKRKAKGSWGVKRMNRVQRFGLMTNFLHQCNVRFSRKGCVLIVAISHALCSKIEKCCGWECWQGPPLYHVCDSQREKLWVVLKARRRATICCSSDMCENEEKTKFSCRGVSNLACIGEHLNLEGTYNGERKMPYKIMI